MKKKFSKMLCLVLATLMVATSGPAAPVRAAEGQTVNETGAAQEVVAEGEAGNSKETASPWEAGRSYVKGDVVSYNGIYYQCIQPHNSQEGWEPSNVPALWNVYSGDIVPEPEPTNPAPTAEPQPTEEPGPVPTAEPQPTEDPGPAPTAEPQPTQTPDQSVTDLPDRVLTGYWQNFDNGATCLKLADVPAEYNIICVSFADATQTPGEITFNLDSGLSKALGGYTVEEFKADIVTAHQKGQKVVLAIGGEVGNVIINSNEAAQAFADSAYALMHEYKFDGIDIDLEHGIDVPHLASSLHLLAEKAGPGFILTMAPQTMDVYTYDATYLKLAREVKDILTIMNTQYYNSGGMPGYGGAVHNQGTIGFLTSLATTQLESGLRPDQIGLGLPAVPRAAGGGYQDPANVAAAMESLVYGTEAGGFTPPKAYESLRGAMTWSINWDATNDYKFAKTVSACFAKLPSLDGASQNSTEEYKPIALLAEDTEKTEPPYPFWQDYKNYPNKNTMVYYKGKIYQNKWYANAGVKPDAGDPWELVGDAEWTVPEDEKNYQKNENAEADSINKVLTDAEIETLYGGINPDFSPEAALGRLEELIPETAYNELFPYRFGSEGWKGLSATTQYYPDPSKLPDYYSYDNLKAAVENLSNTIVKVQWYEGAEWCYRLIRLDKTTKQQKLIYSDASFGAEWLESKTLCTNVCDYGSFLAEGDLNTRKRELAGFLANISHETGGGNIAGEVEESMTGLYFNEEVGFIGSSAIGYVQSTGTAYLPVEGKSYHGRGPIQLSYNYNYGLCSDVLYGDGSILLNNPELVSEDGELGFMTGIWFWMTPQPPKPSCHQVITGTWTPKEGGANAEYNGNFGLTIIIINNEAGQSETGTGAVARRAKYYRIFAGKMGADITNEHCDTVGMTTFVQQTAQN